MVLHIFQSSQFIYGLYVVIDRMSSYESSLLCLNVHFVSFILLDESNKMMYSPINQLVEGSLNY
jgi:hypothetical protein